MHVQLLDQTAVEHHKRRAAGSRRLEGRHYAAAVLELGGRGREGAVGRGEGLRVDERLAIKAEGAALCLGRGACVGRACMGRVRVAWAGCGVGSGCVGEGWWKLTGYGATRAAWLPSSLCRDAAPARSSPWSPPYLLGASLLMRSTGRV